MAAGIRRGPRSVMCAQTAFALLVVLALLLIAALCGALRGGGREGYLIYPYLDLDEPGERGQYYGLTECMA
jgi:hypothetical protein